MASGPDNDGAGRHYQTARARQTRRIGVTRVNQCLTSRKEDRRLQPGGYGSDRSARRLLGRRLQHRMSKPGREATLNACGVGVAMLSGESWAPPSLIEDMVNMGTARWSPSAPTSRVGDGQVRRQLMAVGRGGVLVVVRGRENRPHGEGGQRVRSERLGRSGGRW